MYDFEHVPDRRKTGSVKWDVKPGELPMWIADMDFMTAPEIITAMHNKISHGVFGYEEVTPLYFETIATWYKQVHHATLKNEWLLFTTGVIPAISSIVRRITNMGDNILVQAPVYNIFYNSIENNGRHVLSSDLVYKKGQYNVDYKDLEEKLANPLTTMMLLCNPHNPIGKVWTREELNQIAQLCQKHHVILLSDEIHGDLVLSGHDYTPAFDLADPLKQQIISVISPSKTFNLAALHAATVIISNTFLRNQVNRGLNSDEIAEPNLLAISGSVAAYQSGFDWLKSLKQQLHNNYEFAKNFIDTQIPQIHVVPSSATYLLWIYVGDITKNAEELQQKIQKETGLILSAGNIYRGNGCNFLRLNFACPQSMLNDGLNRLKTSINNRNKL